MLNPFFPFFVSTYLRSSNHRLPRLRLALSKKNLCHSNIPIGPSRVLSEDAVGGPLNEKKPKADEHYLSNPRRIGHIDG
jgi:hypothetical protein